ncbi:MAG: TetR/AcrR family transcriptional regulator [Pseudomonadota bacterium]
MTTNGNQKPGARDNAGRAQTTDEGQPRRRGRPPTFDRNEALRTAGELFQAHGYDAVGIAELTDALGIKPPSLYAAFGCKRGLYQDAVALYAEERGNWVRDTLEGAGPLADRIEALLVAAAETYAASGDARGCLILQGGRNARDADVCAITKSHREATAAYLRTVIARDRPDLASVLADDLMVQFHGLSARAVDGVSKADLVAAARRAGARFRGELKKSDDSA